MHIEVIERGETLWSIGQKYGVSVEEIIRVNGLTDPNHLVIGQTILVPTPDRRHTVRVGESLWSISRFYQVPAQTIAQLNHLAPGAVLRPGMLLRIPNAPKRTIEVNSYLQPSGSQRDVDLVNSTAAAQTYFTLFSYEADAEGNLRPLKDERALEAIRGTDAVAMMGVTNLQGGAFSAAVTKAIFASSEVRERLIANILNTMRQKGYYAVNIDFEHVAPDDRLDYLSFLRELVQRLKPAGHLVCTALAPKTSATQAGVWYWSRT